MFKNGRCPFYIFIISISSCDFEYLLEIQAISMVSVSNNMGSIDYRAIALARALATWSSDSLLELNVLNFT